MPPESHQRPRLLVVEDERWVRESVESTFRWPSSPISQVTAVASGEAGLALLRDGACFELALVDLGLPGMSGVETIQAIASDHPKCAAVAFSVHNDRTHVLQALRAGARGYLTKSASPQAILDALELIASGKQVVSPEVNAILIEAIRRDDRIPREQAQAFETLTHRQRDVLVLLGRGLTYREVADALGIGLGTVQGHVKDIYSRLGVSSKAEVAAVAIRFGLIE